MPHPPKATEQSKVDFEPWSRTMDGSRSSWDKLQAFLAKDGNREIAAFLSPGTADAARVLVVRHGFGRHNTFMGIGSISHEDAELHETGIAQAHLVGNHLRQHGVTGKLNLAVVSPFTRALQTAICMLGPDLGRGEESTKAEKGTVEETLFGIDGFGGHTLQAPRDVLEVLVQPLCAEQTYYISHIGRGNRGSTASELRKRFHMFDFAELDRYCIERRITSFGLEAGKWWHHGPHSNETVASFRRRCTSLKRWLGSLVSDDGVPINVVLISHGGIMEEGFGCEATPANCAFRTYDVFRDGAVRHVATSLAGGRDVGWIHCSMLSEPAFKVYSVLRLEEPHEKFPASPLFQIEIEVDGELCILEARESQLRVWVHDVVDQGLEVFQPGLSDHFQLRGLYPSMGFWGGSLAMWIQDYLEQLAEAMGQTDFPTAVAQQVYECLGCFRVRKASLPHSERRTAIPAASAFFLPYA